MPAASGSTSFSNEPTVDVNVAHEPDAPNDAAMESPTQDGWTLGVLFRTGELGATLPLWVTLRAWCTSPTSTRSQRSRIAELEATITEHADERARTAERLTVLEQECA